MRIRRAVAALGVLLCGVAVAGPVRADPEPPAPTTSAQARAQAAALAARLATLDAQVQSAVADYAHAQTGVVAAASAELAGEQQVDALGAAAAAGRAATGRAIRALYMAGGSTAVYLAALQGGSINDVLAGLNAADAAVNGSTATTRADQAAQQRLGTAVAAHRSAADAAVLAGGQAQQALDRAAAAQAAAAAALATATTAVRRLAAQEQAAAAAAAAASVARTAITLDGRTLVQVLQRAGFTGQALRIAWAVAMRESGGQPGALGAVNGDGTRDHGLFQINDCHIPSLITLDRVYDADANAAAAYTLSRGGTDWSDWAIGDGGWAGHLKTSLPAVYAALQAAYQRWYVVYPGP